MIKTKVGFGVATSHLCPSSTVTPPGEEQEKLLLSQHLNIKIFIFCFDFNKYGGPN